MSYHELVGSFVWHAVMFVYMIAVIVYVGHTVGLIKPVQVRGDVTGQLNQTWSQTTTLLASAADIAKKFNKALEGQPQEGQAAAATTDPKKTD